MGLFRGAGHRSPFFNEFRLFFLTDQASPFTSFSRLAESHSVLDEDKKKVHDSQKPTLFIFTFIKPIRILYTKRKNKSIL